MLDEEDEEPPLAPPLVPPEVLVVVLVVDEDPPLPPPGTTTAFPLPTFIVFMALDSASESLHFNGTLYDLDPSKNIISDGGGDVELCIV